MSYCDRQEIEYINLARLISHLKKISNRRCLLDNIHNPVEGQEQKGYYSWENNIVQD